MATHDQRTLLVTADVVAAMLNVSERTLWRLLSAGKVPQPVRFGRSTRWRTASQQRFLIAHTLSGSWTYVNTGDRNGNRTTRFGSMSARLQGRPRP